MRLGHRLAVLVLAATLGLCGAASAHPEPNDVDGDGIVNAADNCLTVRNADQQDVDGDGAGDRCDADADADGLPNEADNCVLVANPGQQDGNGNGAGDACDVDTDGDQRQDPVDNCPRLANPDQRDNDRDATGDACDPDDDDDGVFDPVDNCVFTYNFEQTDADGDGIGALCDASDVPASAPAGGGGGDGSGGGPPAAPAAGDERAPGVRLALARVQRFEEIEGGLVVALRCTEACVAQVELRVNPATARRLGLARGTRVVARGAAELAQAGRTYAFVRFTRAGKRRLRRARAVRATLVVQAADGAANRRRVTQAVTLRR